MKNDGNYGFILVSSLAILFLAVGFFFMISGFKERTEQGEFCIEQGGFIIQPSPQNYGNILCRFGHENASVKYIAKKIKNEVWAEAMGRNVGDYCFSCWGSEDCRSEHGDILREREVHC